jgi:hypothetical protein
VEKRIDTFSSSVRTSRAKSTESLIVAVSLGLGLMSIPRSRNRGHDGGSNQECAVFALLFHARRLREEMAKVNPKKQGCTGGAGRGRDPDVVEAQMRRITLRLKPEAALKDVVWELSQLFPQQPGIVQ